MASAETARREAASAIAASMMDCRLPGAASSRAGSSAETSTQPAVAKIIKQAAVEALLLHTGGTSRNWVLQYTTFVRSRARPME
jgi:hypothetical protein